jgi:hypothetical protein
LQGEDIMWNSVGSAQILAVHAALLKSGKIVVFSGDEHDRAAHIAGDINHTRMVDCTTFAVSVAGSPASDLFCCGHAFLSDGRLLVAGGTEEWGGGDAHGIHGAAGHFSGLRDANIFNYATTSWTPASDMIPEPGMSTGGGRWYPTLVTLPDGRVLAMSGHPKDDDTRHSNLSLEAFSSTTSPGGSWSQIGSDSADNDTTYYPRLMVLPGGKVFCANLVGGATKILDTATGTWMTVGTAVPNDAGENIYRGIAGTAVLLPLLPIDGYRARVLVCNDTTPYVFDTTMPGMGWVETSPRAVANAPRRRNGCATLLPTGEVFVSGGAPNASNDAGGLMPAEIYSPALDSWSSVETPTIVRNYHSVALLLPDGRVWTAGSNINCQQSFFPAGADNRQLTMEVYSPWYHGRADRPIISAAPDSANYNSAFRVDTPQAATISRVALVRCGTSTHAFNGDQRHVGCRFTRGNGYINVTSPPDGAIAPPGYYLLFLLGPGNVPSIGHFIKLPSRQGKMLKEIKDFDKPFTKETIKEFITEGKPFVRDKPVKEFKELKEGKEFKEFKEKDKDLVEGFPFERPEQIFEIIANLNQQVQELDDFVRDKKQPFIRRDERPFVGKPTKLKAAKASGKRKVSPRKPKGTRG